MQKLLNSWELKLRVLKHFSRILFSFFLTASCITYSQSLYFCESVDEHGEPVNSSGTFTISSDGSYLDFLVRTDNSIGVNSVCYKIYEVKNGKEIYDNTIWQEVEPEWTWFWNEIIFYKDGTFNVYVYDEEENFIASGTIEINYK
jgi:hypothetical protein